MTSMAWTQGSQILDFRIFISYPRGGRTHSLAQELYRELSALGATVFMDEPSLLAGSCRLSGQIERGIARANVLLFLLGSDTSKCDWQEREARNAQERRVPVVVAQTCAVSLPVYVGDAVPVSATEPLAQWLPVLVNALAREATPRLPLDEMTPDAGSVLDARLDEAVSRYLDDRLATDFSDRVERYVPLAGQRREVRSPYKGRKNLRFAPRIEGRQRGEEGAYAEYTDVLDAYRELPGYK